MNAGRLNRRIELQQQSTEQDSFGQQLTTWKTFHRTWASIDVISGKLLYSNAEFMSKLALKIIIRWIPNIAISAKQRILYRDAIGVHTYVIESVINDRAANKQLTLMCYALEDTN